MTLKDKELLLKDLCARLPYGVKCSFGVDDAIYEICGINPVSCGASEIQATHIKSGINGDFTINACKPYLFPLSSMTAEQLYELRELFGFEIEFLNGFIELSSRDTLEYLEMIAIIEWFNKNHFDYRGLIPMGLAIDCTNLNIY